MHAINRLVDRGLGTRFIVEVDGVAYHRITPTPLGRIALRVERLIRSGGALKGAA